jgi:hypothetical protein
MDSKLVQTNIGLLLSVRQTRRGRQNRVPARVSICLILYHDVFGVNNTMF